MGWTYSRLSSCAVFLTILSFLPGAPAQNILKRQKALRASLLENYEIRSPPATDNGPVQVQVQFALGQFSEVSTVAERIEMKGWWRHWWTDSRLQWNETEWDVQYMTFPADQVWIPDVLVYEHVTSEIFVPSVTVNPDGACLVSIPRVSIVACPMQLQAFPFDHQRCNFTVGSWSFDGTIVDIVPREVDAVSFWEPSDHPLPSLAAVDMAPYREFSEWRLTAMRTVWRNVFYNCCPEPFPVLIYEIEIHRATQTYFSGQVGPLLVVTIVGFCSLLMPAPISGSRPTLSVTILLTTATVYFVASATTPNSNSTTVVGRLYTAALVIALVLVVISIVTTALNTIQPVEKVSPDKLLEMFRQYDANKDGVLSRAEALNLLATMQMGEKEQARVVSYLDKNQDGVISLDEWMQIGALLSRAEARATYHNTVIEWLVRSHTKTQSKLATREENGSVWNRSVSSLWGSGLVQAPLLVPTPAPTHESPGGRSQSEELLYARNSLASSQAQSPRPLRASHAGAQQQGVRGSRQGGGGVGGGASLPGRPPSPLPPPTLLTPSRPAGAHSGPGVARLQDQVRPDADSGLEGPAGSASGSGRGAGIAPAELIISTEPRSLRVHPNLSPASPVVCGGEGGGGDGGGDGSYMRASAQAVSPGQRRRSFIAAVSEARERGERKEEARPREGGEQQEQAEQQAIEDTLAGKVAGAVNCHVAAQRKGREVAAAIDSWALAVLPLSFLIYLVLEVTGIWAGHRLMLNGAYRGHLSPVSGQSKTRVEFVDERSAGNGTALCYRNFQASEPVRDMKAILEQCGADAR